MSRFPADLKYTSDHEWAKIEGNQVTVGITDHAQGALGDVVFVELPAVGKTLKKGDTFGVVESIKAVSDLYSPVTGKIVSANTALVDDPSRINRESQSGAWLIKMEMTDAASASELLDAAAYEKIVAALK